MTEGQIAIASIVFGPLIAFAVFALFELASRLIRKIPPRP